MNIHSIFTEQQTVDFLSQNGFTQDGFCYAINGKTWEGLSINKVDEYWELRSHDRSSYDVLATFDKDINAYRTLIMYLMTFSGKWK